MQSVKKSISLFDILIFIGILFIGTDKWAINLGVNIRLVQIYYIFVIGYLVIKKKYCFYYNPLVILFLAVASISTVFSLDYIQSLPYYIWIIYDILILMPMFYCYINDYGPKRLLNVFKYVFITMFFLIFVQFFLDGILGIELAFLSCQHHLGVMRPALWFYEPSYLSTFMLIYFSMSSYMLLAEKNIKQIILFIMMGMSVTIITSTTGFLVMAIVIFITFIMFLIGLKNKRQRILAIITFVACCLIAVGLIYVLLPSVFDLFIMRLFRSGISGSASERVADYKNQLNAWISSPLFGVGLDCYGVFLGNKDIVATNISLELLATTGFFGFITFYGLVFYPIVKVFWPKKGNIYPVTRVFAFGLFILIVALQANQNFMRLYLWMMIFVTLASMKYEENVYEDSNRL